MLRSSYERFLTMTTSAVVASVLTVVISIPFSYQYAKTIEHQLIQYIELSENVDINQLCQLIECVSVRVDNITYIHNALTTDLKVSELNYSSELISYNNVSLRYDWTVFLTINPEKNHITYQIGINISRFNYVFILLFVMLVVLISSLTLHYKNIVLQLLVLENRICASKDKTLLQLDNLLFYIDNLNNETNSPLFIISRKIKELRNEFNDKIYEDTFNLIFNSIDKIALIIQRSYEIKKVHHSIGDRTIHALLESTIISISDMSSVLIKYISDTQLENYYLNQSIMPNGVFNNIMTNHINNSIEAAANELSVAVVSVNNNILSFTFTDNGNGIEKGIRGEIFDSGFSTKTDQSLSYGYGLSINKQIIQSVNGLIKLNEITEGAQFQISIPVKRK